MVFIRKSPPLKFAILRNPPYKPAKGEKARLYKGMTPLECMKKYHSWQSKVKVAVAFGAIIGTCGLGMIPLSVAIYLHRKKICKENNKKLTMKSFWAGIIIPHELKRNIIWL